jgi:tetratricopeptide (TPR) repeat protein
MRQLAAILALATLFTVAQARDLREDTIWSAAHARFDAQTDRWFSDGDYPRCIQMLRVMHEIWPSDYETTTNLGWMLGNVEQPDEELAVYKAYRSAYPTDPEAAYPEAEFFYMKKQYDKVPPLIDHTLAKKPHPNSFRILAHSYEKLGKLQDAKRVWEMLIAMYPNEQAIETSKMHLRQVEAKIKQAETAK